jgi:hypothetical protein
LKFKPLPATPDTQIPLHMHRQVLQPQDVIKRNEHVNKLTALPKPERPLGIKSVEGRPKRYFDSKPLKTTGPFSSSVFTTNSHYAIGMRPRNASPGFIRKWILVAVKTSLNFKIDNIFKKQRHFLGRCIRSLNDINIYNQMLFSCFTSAPNVKKCFTLSS